MSERPRPNTPPPPRASRPAVGLRARRAARMPSPEARAAAQTVVLADADTSVATVMAKLPDPERLPPGTLVLVPGSSGERSLARSVLAVFGRAKSVPRAVRCTALVARGYRDVGAAEDLAWGFVGPIGG